MSFQLKGFLIILLLLALALLIVWAPWERPGRPTGMPAQVFAPFDGEWQGKFWSYSIGGGFRDSIQERIRLRSVGADSQVGEVIALTGTRDTLSRDSLFRTRRGDTLYSVRMHEDGRRDLERGYWTDGQIVWRSQDVFGRVAHAYRERIRKDIWERDGFTRTSRGDYLLQYGRALRR